jgi:hypothetical protein
VRRLLPLAAVVLAVGPAAAGTPAAKVLGTHGQVVSISADGGSVAIHAATNANSQKPCDSAAIWTPATGKVVHLVDKRCGANDARFDDLTFAGTTAVWTDYDYGNHAYCTGPLTATLTAPNAHDSNQCGGDGDVYYEYGGDGSLLVGRDWLSCDYDCGPDCNGSYQADVELVTVGAKVKKLTDEKRNTDLLDVDAGRILLRWKQTLIVKDGGGKQVASFPAPGRGAAYMDGADRVSVPNKTTLTTYDIATGKVVETCTMKPHATLEDVENGVAVYIKDDDEVHLLTIATNHDVVAATAQGLVEADLEPNGLYYAYNVPSGGSSPGRVAFIAASSLPK